MNQEDKMKQPPIKDVYLYRYFKKLMFISLWISGIALVVEYAIPIAFQSATTDLMSTASNSVSSGAAAGGNSILNHIKYSINPLILTACVVGYIAACYLVYKSPDNPSDWIIYPVSGLPHLSGLWGFVCVFSNPGYLYYRHQTAFEPATPV